MTNFPNTLGAKIRRPIEKLLNEYKPQKVILFGSFACGLPDSESDIDILIIKDTAENPIKRRVTIRQILNITDPDYPPVSPLVITPKELETRLQIGDQFIKDILDKGIILYDK